MVDAEGQAVSHSCTQCHHILAWDSPDPFRFLQPLEADDPDLELHRSLQAEFVGVVPRLPDEEQAQADDPYLPWMPERPVSVEIADSFAPLAQEPTWAEQAP
jgi:hypothetical protein